jgi:O-antigen/teichoic acid export membrane protein
LKRTIFQSNLLSFEGIAQVQVPTLLLGAFAGVTETGLYKVGMAIAALIGSVAAPVSGALLPRVSRLWSQERFVDLRRLLKQATFITVPLIALLYLLVVLLRNPILELIGGGPEARAAGTVLILGAGGQAVAAAVFWRSNMLHAAHRTGVVAGVSIIGAALQVALVLLLVPPFGAEGAALAFLLSRIFINGTLGYRAIRTLNNAIARQTLQAPACDQPDLMPTRPG